MCVLLTGLVVVTAEEVYASVCVCAVDRPGGGDGRGGIRQCVCC